MFMYTHSHTHTHAVLSLLVGQAGSIRGVAAARDCLSSAEEKTSLMLAEALAERVIGAVAGGMRPYATSVLGLKLLVYEALNY